MNANPRAKKTTKKAQAIELHKQGKTNKEIAAIVYPDQAPSVAKVSVSRALKDNHVQEWVADAIGKAGLDLYELILQYKEELQATKPIYFKGDYIDDVPDYPTRQKARDAIVRMMQAYTPAAGDPTPPPQPPHPLTGGTTTGNEQHRQAMLEALKNKDIKAIERIVFNTEPEQ